MIPSDEVAIVIAAMENWIKGSVQGKEYIVDLLGFDWTRGSPEVNYDVKDQYGRFQRLKSEQVYFLQTAVAKGEFLPPSQLVMTPVEKNGCDKCGILAHCNRTSKGESICNRCLQYTEDRELGGGLKECEACTALGCEHHPMRDQRRLA